MKNLITIILISILFLIAVKSVSADQIAGSSAAIKNDSVVKISQNELSNDEIYKIKKTMQNVLKKYDSPMSGEIDSFMATCIKYKLDCYLLPSIAGLESTFGRFIWPESNNPFGWGGGTIMFKDWNEGIQTVGRGLRKNYIDKGADDLSTIGHIYSESPTWTPRVQYFINSFRDEEAKIELFLARNPVQ